MKIAVIGAGISGLASMWRLHPRHDAVLFEADGRLGGHVNTVGLTVGGESVAVDTGFIVYNRRNYPGFSAMLDTLGVETRPATMSFSVSCAETGIEYAGHDLNGLFAQRRNLVRPQFIHMVRDILRFNRRARVDADAMSWDMSIDDYLSSAGFDGLFRSHYLLPMAAAIWSAPTDSVARMPARLLVDFFENHGLLTLRDRPQWRTIVGGSRRYVDELTAPFRSKIRTACPVRSVSRSPNGVIVQASGGEQLFDHVVFACHAGQALSLLAEPSGWETEILGALPTERNAITLHSDIGTLPRARRAWAAWNYTLIPETSRRARVTYNMNLLQGLDCEETLCVTLNDDGRIADDKILGEYSYDHPVYSASSQAARQRRWEISGRNRTWYCGAYWGSGFHEDGFQSAMDVADRLTAETREAA